MASKRKGVSVRVERIPQPPDKRRFEQENSDFSHKIKDLEAQRKLLSSQNGLNINAEMTKLNDQISEVGEQKAKTSTEMRNVDEKIRKLGPVIIDKKNVASKIVVMLSYNKSEEKYDEAIGKLRQQLLTKQFSGNEERKLQSEIDKLESSKGKLKEYLSLKAEIEGLRGEQEQLRNRREELFKKSRELRNLEGELKDKQEGFKKQMEECREKKRDIQSQKDALSEEIQALYKARQQLRENFRKAQASYLEASSRLSVEEMAEKERETQRREEERKARRRRMVMEEEMQRELQFEEERMMCKCLLSHLEKLGLSETPTAALSVCPLSVHSPPHSPLLNTHTSSSSHRPVPKGEFLPRKKDDHTECLMPALGRRKSRKDKKKHSSSGRAQRKLQYDPVILEYFSRLCLTPPTTHPLIAHTLHALQEKLAFYEGRKYLAAESEAGDSGIGSQALGDITSEQDLNSQDDINFDHPATATTTTTISPKRQMTDSLTPSCDTQQSPGDLTSNHPSLLPTPSPLGAKKLHHSVSNSTNASNNSSTTLLCTNDE